MNLKADFSWAKLGLFVAKFFLALIIGYLIGNVFPAKQLQGCNNLANTDSSSFKIIVKQPDLIIGDSELTPQQKKEIDSLRKIHGLE